MSGFWRSWMIVWCGGVALFGIVLTGGGLEATSAPARHILALVGGNEELALDAPLRFSLAILGAVTIGWSLTLLAVVRVADKLSEDVGRQVWLFVTSSVLTWYVIDCTLSVVTGFGLNAVLNTILLITFLVPVLCSGVLQR